MGDIAIVGVLGASPPLKSGETKEADLVVTISDIGGDSLRCCFVAFGDATVK